MWLITENLFHRHPDHAIGPQWTVRAAVAVGGAAGAFARYGVSRIWRNGTDAYLVWRSRAAAFPWTTLTINAVGCFALGVLSVTLSERFPNAPRWLKPMLATGVLGGFTTFSSYTDDTRRLFENDQAAFAVANLMLTVIAALTGVTLGSVLTHALLRRQAPANHATKPGN